MLITGILTIFAGIAEGLTHQNRPYVFHIVAASIFILLCIIHIIVNRKAVMKYIRGAR